MTPQLTFRSTAARVTAYAWLAFAAFNLLDLAVGITGSASYSLVSATMAALLLVGCGIAYVVGLRPAILADEAGVTVRNPLRDVRVPWRAVREFEGGTAVTVRFAGPGGAELKSRAWVLQTSPRAQAKAEARARREAADTRRPAVAAQVKGRTPATYAAQQLNEMAERNRLRPKSGAPGRAAAAKEAAKVGNGPETGAVNWSVPATAVLGVPLVLLVAVILAAVLA